MIAGLESISGGELRIGERVVNEVSPRDRDIAMVFQSYALYPHMTVYENMAFGLKIRKVAKGEIDRRVRAAARLLELDELLQRRPKALSGGQRQRVAMGRAVVREPAVFLFDEPLSNLDAKLRVQMRLEIARLHKRLKATIVYVTHDQVEAMTLADRIAIMHEGILQQCDTPQRVFRSPVNTFVATFIGSPAMNLWPVEAARTGQGLALRAPGISLAIPAGGAEALETILAGAGPEAAGHWTLGVRPQDLEVAHVGEPALAELQVDVVEPLGAETFVYGALVDGAAPGERDPVTRERLRGPVVLQVAPEVGVRPGDRVPLAVPTDRIHLFAAGGRRLVGPSAA
jgi:multiple sugar transport system ATP-binding protein